MNPTEPTTEDELPASPTGKKRGPKKVMTDELKRDLLRYLITGASVRTACSMVGISHMTYYRSLGNDAAWNEHIESLIGSTKYAAEAVMHDAIIEDKSVSAAQWYLKHKHSDEYNTKGDRGTTDTSSITEDLRTLLKKIQSEETDD